MAQHLATKYGMTLEEAADRLQSLNDLAAADGLQYDLARTQAGNTLAAHRLIHLGNAQDLEVGAQVKEALLDAYFIKLLPISDPEVLLEAGVRAGLDRAEVDDLLAGDRYTDAVRLDEAEAAALGSTGVPFFVFDRQFAVPGAQEVDVFLITLRRAWDRARQTEEAGTAGRSSGS